ncbi:MAG TPA: peptidoglycan-binding protein [Acidimicrobiales bacterium]|nr:peptidoglycan-binding protein [Acidimicrobiales bacterium]
MTTVVQFLDACAQDEGYREDPPGSNRTRFAAQAGHPNGFAWCQTWCVAKAKQTRLALPPGVAETAYTPSAVNAWKRAGRWFTDAGQPGDWAYFQFDGDPQVDHVGIVESVRSDGTLVTIEGNTSSTERGSQSNGGQVARRVRRRALVVGFGRPVFDAAPASKAPASAMYPGRPLRIGSLYLDAVKAVQERLGVEPASGKFGARTEAAVERFQRARGLDVDGVVGKQTWAALWPDQERGR